ncbi:hypothetical protein CHS0354_024451 [Potamilus streckersoni]|uniref:Uncharacterized protein n=1 Tax=Potamilus streckersoni TaxID=2493646 RepID=A0AAE0TMU7_9BIVA|nr:hypothetical protein CHS0354_024451 [Potamilus streckersoni]
MHEINLAATIEKYRLHSNDILMLYKRNKMLPNNPNPRPRRSYGFTNERDVE